MILFFVFVIPAFVIWCLNKALFSQKKVYDLKGKVVLITGASSGLGQACAYKFVEAGSKVILSARNINKLKEIRDDIVKQFGKHDDFHEPKVLYVDLDNLESLPKAGEDALMHYGHIDILVNNAGISYRGSILETEMDVHHHLMRVNYFGHLSLTKCILPSMITRKQGHILSVSSVQGKVSIPFRSAYTASKHAFDAFYNCLRSEVAEYNIHVTVVSPGYIRTNLSINARTGDGRQYGALDPSTAQGMEPSSVAMEVIKAIECHEEDVIIADVKTNLGILLKNLWPSLFYRIMKKRAIRERKHKEKAE